MNKIAIRIVVGLIVGAVMYGLCQVIFQPVGVQPDGEVAIRIFSVWAAVMAATFPHYFEI